MFLFDMNTKYQEKNNRKIKRSTTKNITLEAEPCIHLSFRGVV